MPTKNPTNLPESETEYILTHYQNTSVPDMAAKLGRALKTVYDFLRIRELKPFKKPQPPKSRNHPFRERNRDLEKYHLARKLERQPKNYK